MSIEQLDEASPDNAVLVLYPPDLVDSNKSVAGADCGIAINFYDLTPMGAKVRVDPYFDQAPLDTVALLLNGKLVASTQTQSTNDAVILYIPKNELKAEPGFVNYLAYSVTRGSQNQGTSEPPLGILYNDIRPGIEDRVQGDDGHSELELILPQDVLEDGIDADRAAQGVLICFSYPYCRPYDKIHLNCNGHDVYRDVTADEAPSVPTSEPTRICLTLDKAVFERAGDHPQFVFNFTVSDQIGNGADPDSPWSASTLVEVDLNGVRLVAPDVAEDPDDPNDAPDTIDLNKLGSKDLTVQVHAFSPVWSADDVIRVKYIATPYAGGAAVEHSVETTVNRIPFTYKLMIPNAKVIADSQVKVSYEQVRGGEVFAKSKAARARVILAPVITSVKNSAGGEIANGGDVSDNKVMLMGSALAGTTLRIFDGETFVEEVQTGANYKWQSTLIPIVVGQHSFTAREKSGEQLVSGPWSVKRLAFSIDRTQMNLNGFSVKIPQWPKTGEDSVGNTATRNPVGGVPRYEYASSDPSTAPVTATGKVTGLKNGVVTIYVTDQEGTTLTYLVAVTNVFKLQISDQVFTFLDAEKWMNSLGGRHTYDYVFRNDIVRVYLVPARETNTWTCAIFGAWRGYIFPNNTFQTTRGNPALTSWCLTAI
ncbi:Ig-like domain-containing protein [Pseudomonas sp. CLCA07]